MIGLSLWEDRPSLITCSPVRRCTIGLGPMGWIRTRTVRALPPAAVRTGRARLMFPSRAGFPVEINSLGASSCLDSMPQQELETIFDDIILNRLG